MPRLESNPFSIMNPVTAATKNAGKMAIGGALQIYKQTIKNTNLNSPPVADRVTNGVVQGMNLARRSLEGNIAKEQDWDTYYTHPGYVGVYKDGRLVDIITFQFQAKINDDSRSATYDSEEYGVNELDFYSGTPLREITLETKFANTDPYLYSAHYVEKKVRKLQALVSPNYFMETSAETDVVQSIGNMLGFNKSPETNNNMGMQAPPIIGLFIGDKFLRRRLPNIQYSQTGDSKFSIDFPENSILGKFLGLWEPIYWKVTAVEASWDESPFNIDFGEVSTNFIPGESKLPMYQTVNLTLKEHRSPNTFERDADSEYFNTINNIGGRAIGL